MSNYRDNCKHFRYIYKEVKGLNGSVDRMKVGGKCLIDRMVYRKCPKDCNWFEET